MPSAVSISFFGHGNANNVVYVLVVESPGINCNIRHTEEVYICRLRELSKKTYGKERPHSVSIRANGIIDERLPCNVFEQGCLQAKCNMFVVESYSRRLLGCVE